MSLFLFLKHPCPSKRESIKLIFAVFFGLFFVVLSGCKKEDHYGQNKSFVKFYGGSEADAGNDVKQTSDGGYVAIGTIAHTGRGTDIFLVKTDPYGNQQWMPKYYGGTGNDAGYSLQMTPDGGYILAGSIDTLLNGVSATKSYIVKTDENGDVIWTKILNGSSNDKALFVQLNGNNGYLIAGYVENSGLTKDATLTSLDLNGNINWTRSYSYGSSYDDVASCVQVTPDGFILIGSSQSHVQGPANAFLIKTNSLGLIQQTTLIGGTDNITGAYIQALSDGSFIGLGNRSTGSMFLFKLDNSLNNVWSQVIGGATGNDSGSSIQIISDNEIALVGTHTLSDNSSNFSLFKTDGQGNLLFSRYYGQAGLQRATAFTQTTDGGFIMVGSNNIEGMSTMTLIKVKPNGEL